MLAKLITAALGASLIASAGCATPSGTGTAIGAVGGGAIGGALGGTTGLIVGAAAGGLLGYGVGRNVEIENERRMAYALEVNRPQVWVAPDTGYRYTIQPGQSYYGYGGQPCRGFRMLADIGGQPRQLYGTACRDPNGTWRVVQTY